MRSVVIATMVGISVATALTTSMGAHAASYTTASYSWRLLTLVNEVRMQHGAQPLTLVPGTTEVAAGWTEHLASAQLLSHNPRLGRDLSTHGSRRWLAYGENVGTGAAEDPDSLFEAYMNSPEHRANILDKDYRYVGVAVVFTGDRAWNTFDFVDVYRTASSPTTVHRRSHPVTRSVRTRSVARSAATVSTPPVRPSHRAARPAGPVVVHVEALRQQVVRKPVVRLATEPVAAVTPVLDTAHGHGTGARRHAVAIAVAVLSLLLGSRRWLLVAGRHA